MTDINSLFGNAALRAKLCEIVACGRVSHAYIFEGPTGVGKRTLALAFASMLVCEKQAGAPCGVCASCKKSAHPDVSIIEGEGKSGNVKVDRIRELRSDIYIRPNEAERKVYIVDDAEKLQAEAQNALLKVFEEPPAYAVIILLCANLGALLPTIRSRAVSFSVHPLSEKEEIPALSKLIKKPKAELLNAATLSCGCIGQAIRILTDKQAKAAAKLAGDFILQLKAPRSDEGFYELLKLSVATAKTRELFAEFLTALLSALETLLRRGDVGGSLTNARALHIINKIYEIREMLSGNVNLSLLAHSFCIECLEVTSW